MAYDKGHKKKYTHFFKAAPPDLTFPDAYKRILVTEPDHLQSYLEQFLRVPDGSRICSFDTETASLSPEVDPKIIGFSFSYRFDEAIYVPVSHAVGENYPDKLQALRAVYECLKRSDKSLMANARFDLRMMEYSGFPMKREVPYFDILALTWLTDTNVKMPSLKWAEKHFLGWDREVFGDVAGADNTLLTVDPKDCKDYAAFDAISPLMLLHRLANFYRKHSFVTDLDNRTILPVMVMEETPTPVNKEYLQGMLVSADEKLRELEIQAFQQVGYTFTLNSPKQISDALEKLGISTGKLTKTGMSTREDDLKKVTDKHPVVQTIMDYKITLKLKSSFILPLLRDTREDIGGCRFAYQTNNVPTGRLSSGADKKNPYFAHLNVQAIVKAKPHMFHAHEDPNKTLLNSSEAIHGTEHLLGWTLIPCVRRCSECTEKCDYPVEGSAVDNNLRRALHVPPGFIWVHFDYSGQELRIPTNLSNNPVMMRTFLSGGDPHKDMAITMYGPDNYDKEKRRKAKNCNFGALYGGTKYTLARQMVCSPEEAEVHLQKWWAVQPVLKRWSNEQAQLGKRNGVVYTHFGRPRPVRFWWSSAHRGDRGFAYRTCVNNPVQGAAADILRIALCRIWDKILSVKKYGDDFRLYNTVHDEINFACTPKILNQACDDVRECLEFPIPGWKLPMVTDIELGYSWGGLYGFERDEDGRWYPVKEG